MFLSSVRAVKPLVVMAELVENRLPQLTALAFSASTSGGPISSGTNDLKLAL